MFDDETMRVIAKLRWSADDLCEQLDLMPEELTASNELTEKILMLADEEFCRAKAANPSLRARYFVAAIARAMTGVTLLAQMHKE
jgi:hypothetical protein